MIHHGAARRANHSSAVAGSASFVQCPYLPPSVLPERSVLPRDAFSRTALSHTSRPFVRRILNGTKGSIPAV